MDPVSLHTPRFMLRDFEDGDRRAFLAYQTDPRYLALYDFDEGDAARAERLFELFLKWRDETPRRNYQLGIFDRSTGDLLGCGGLREASERVAVLGIELAPAQWGRFRLALDAAGALVDFGFGTLGLETILGSTASGNSRVEKLARRFGAEITAQRAGPAWMQVRGWEEVDWVLKREARVL